MERAFLEREQLTRLRSSSFDEKNGLAGDAPGRFLMDLVDRRAVIGPVDNDLPCRPQRLQLSG